MKERPILFTGEMVRAILDGRKTQTRRLVKPQPHEGSKLWGMIQHDGEPRALFWCEGQPSNYGTPLPMHVGDRLWVRETWSWSGVAAHHQMVLWRADREYSDEERRRWIWRPSIHMPRWASRIDLEITAVRVDRVQDITEEDAKAEGVESGIWEREAQLLAGATDADDEDIVSFRDGFGFLWQSIYANWDANPWVWVYEFRRIKP